MREVGEKYNIIVSVLKKNGLLEKDSPIKFSNSKGGFYLGGKFKDGRNTDELLKQALQYGVSFIPGSIYGKRRRI